MHIDFYEFGRIKIDGKYYDRDVIILPGHVISPWIKTRSHYIDAIELFEIQEIFEEKPDAIVIGTGSHGVFNVSPDVEEFLRDKNVGCFVQKTFSACDTYNNLISKNKKVVALLHLTC